MKIDGTLLTLCAFLPTTTTGFGFHSTAIFRGIKTPKAQLPSVSYVGRLGAFEDPSSVSGVATSNYTLGKDASYYTLNDDEDEVNGDFSDYGDDTVR
jgi:hypothetical protein